MMFQKGQVRLLWPSRRGA